MMDETRRADEIRRLLEVAEASEKPWDWEYGLSQAKKDIHYLLDTLDAAEQRAAEAEALLAECKGHLANVTEKQWAYDTGRRRVFCPWCGGETLPPPGRGEVAGRKRRVMAREIYAVVFGNYFPRETDTLWSTEELAEERAEQLDGDWRVVPMLVHESLDEIPDEE